MFRYFPMFRDASDVQSYKADLDKDDASVTSSNDEKKAALDTIWNEMQQLGVTDNKYTVLTIKVWE